MRSLRGRRRQNRARFESLESRHLLAVWITVGFFEPVAEIYDYPGYYAQRYDDVDSSPSQAISTNGISSFNAAGDDLVPARYKLHGVDVNRWDHRGV